MKAQGITVATEGPKGVGWAFGTSLAVHGVALAAIVWGWGSAPVQVGVPIMDVELVVAAPGESGSTASDPAATSVPVAPAGKASTPRESTRAGSQPAPTPTPVAPAEALLAPDVEPPPSTPTVPSAQSDKHDTGAPADKGSATTSIPIILPEPLPVVRSEDVLHQPTPAPTAEVPPTAPQIPPPAPQPKATTPAQSPPAAPPRTASPPRQTPPPTQKRTQPDAASAHAPATPTPQAGSGPTQGTESAGGGPAAGGARLLRHVAPVYPALARERGLEGRVVVRLLIGADGVPAEIRVSQSSGFESLDSAAIDAVRQWRFDPARRAGVAVSEERLAPVVFRLRR